MTETEKVMALEEARELITEALGLIRGATEGDAYVENYLCAPLSLMVTEGIYVSHDVTIDWVIERIEENGPDEDDDDNDSVADDEGMAGIEDSKHNRGYMGRTGRDEDGHCEGCGSALNTAPPCPTCGERMCQDCADHHVCDPK